jgi:hypothetical protein
MKTLVKLVMALVVLGFCLPSYGEILVYKYTAIQTGYEWQDNGWELNKATYHGYFVLSINYDDQTVEQAERIDYLNDSEGKRFDEHPTDLELVRVELDTASNGWSCQKKSTLWERR